MRSIEWRKAADSCTGVAGIPKHSSLGKMDTCDHWQRCKFTVKPRNHVEGLCRSGEGLCLGDPWSRWQSGSADSRWDLAYYAGAQAVQSFAGLVPALRIDSHFFGLHGLRSIAILGRHRNKIPETAGHFYEQPLGSQKKPQDQRNLGMSENGVYPQWNSHLVGIMISKTIGFRGTLFSDKPIWIFNLLQPSSTSLCPCCEGGIKSFTTTPHQMMSAFARPGKIPREQQRFASG